MQSHSLRHRLRIETQIAHQNLEQRCEALINGSEDGLKRFVAMHLIAYEDFLRFGQNLLCRSILTDLADRARRDIAFDMPPMDEMASVDPLAIDYVVCGSQHGMRVLRKRYERHILLKALSFFDAPCYLETWSVFRDRVNTIDPSSEQADKIVREASVVFDFYSRIASALQEFQEVSYA